jgi:hypothetical protein
MMHGQKNIKLNVVHDTACPCKSYLKIRINHNPVKTPELRYMPLYSGKTFYRFLIFTAAITSNVTSEN